MDGVRVREVKRVSERVWDHGRRLLPGDAKHMMIGGAGGISGGVPYMFPMGPADPMGQTAHVQVSERVWDHWRRLPPGDAKHMM